MEHVAKREVEELLGYGISDDRFQEALECARRKQEYIYSRDPRPAVLQRWYLVKLTEEYVSSLELTQVTMDLCREVYDMEKEHSVLDQSALQDTHIVTASA